MVLTVADVEQWNAGAVRDVFRAATARGNATLEASRQLSTLAVFDTWEGLTAEARKHTNASIRQDLDAHGNESLAVAQAARKAADDIEKVQSELRTLQHDASQLHMSIDALSNKIVPAEKMPPMEAEIAEMQLEPRLNKILAEANAVDAELAAAINMAEGNAPGASAPPSAPIDKQNGTAPLPPGQSQRPRSNDPPAKAPAAQGQPPNIVDALTAAAQGKPDPTDQHYTRSPLTDPVVAADPSVVARQASKVADARRALDGAQAKLDAAAKRAYTEGPGSGRGRDVTDPLSQAVFDARRNLTEQSAILDDLNKSAATTGAAQPVPTPPLPPHAGVQAFPPEPSIASQAAQGLTESSHDINKYTLGLVPDVAKDMHTFSHWGDASSGNRTDALLDSTSLLPFGKALGEAHHGLDALGGISHHIDDVPGIPHADPPSGPHTGTFDHPASGDQSLPQVEHPTPAGGDHALSSPPDAPQAVEGHDYGLSPQHAFELSPDPADEVARLQAGGVPSHVTDGYDPFAGRTVDQYKDEFTVPGHDGLPRWDWDGQAPHNGFAEPPSVTDRIPEGHLLDRLGSDGGAFMADDGASLSTRSMPPGVASQYHQYVGTGEPIPPDLNAEVRHGPAGGAFGQPGGANQWVVVDKTTGEEIPVQILRQRGIIDAIRPPGS